MALHGIDASRHQGTVDWNRVKGAGNDFAFIKATDGVAYAWISWYHQNAPRVKAAGLILGAYHFLLDHHPGAAQARYYVQEINRSGGFHGVVPIIDIEREADGTTPRIQHLRDFVAEFRRLVPGRAILIYTGRWYWVGVIGDPFGADLGPLWHSEYDGQSPIDFEVTDGPELDKYGGWTDCLAWQYTSTGSVPGVGGNCDRNLFYGSRLQLLALAGLTTLEDDLDSTEHAWLEEVVRRNRSMHAANYQATDGGPAGDLTWLDQKLAPIMGKLNEMDGNITTRLDTIEDRLDAIDGGAGPVPGPTSGTFEGTWTAAPEDAPPG